MATRTLSLSPKKIRFAKELRQRQTSGERVLWKKLRAYRLGEWKFRRQVLIGPFIADFACIKAKLIVEVDGDSHWQPGAQERDRNRDVFLNAAGLTVLHFSNRYILESTSDVLDEIRRFMEKRT